MTLVLKLEKEIKKFFNNFFNSKMNPFRICQAKDYYIFLNKRFTYLVNNDSLCLNSTLTFEKLSGSII